MVKLFNNLIKTENKALQQVKQPTLNADDADKSKAADTPKLADSQYLFSFNVCEVINAYIFQKGIPMSPLTGLDPDFRSVVLTFGEVETKIGNGKHTASTVVQKVRFHDAAAEESFLKLLYYFAAKNVSQTIKYFQSIRTSKECGNFSPALDNIINFLNDFGSSAESSTTQE